MRTLVATGIVLAVGMLGCAASPPAQWAKGGATLEIATATWSRTDGDVVIAPNGVVTVAGEKVFTIDAQGRVSDEEGQPYAVLEQGGRLAGPGDRTLATVRGPKVDSATRSPSVTVGPNGAITFNSLQGEQNGGGFVGDCTRSPATQSFCGLVAYLVTRDDLQRQARQDETALRRQSNRPRR